MIKGKFFFTTPAGNEWLEQNFEAPDTRVAKMLLLEYLCANEVTANRLVEGWLRNGESEEEAQLWSCVECSDKEAERALMAFLETF